MTDGSGIPAIATVKQGIMILHLFVGDLYIERFPPSLKFLKLVVKLDECREHGVASDLYLSDNIVRFNQTIHFPVGDDDSTIINELEVVLYSIQTDSEEILLGFSKFVCTSGEHSITKTITLHDSRGVLVGKVPVTTFYYKSAIKLGDRVMFKPRYEPNAKEYSFLLSRRFRQPAKARPVTFNGDIEHRLDNEARDLIARDFKIVSSNKVQPKKATTTAAAPSNTAAKDSMTYNPGMTRNGAMSDAARGRVMPKQQHKSATQKKAKKPAPAAPPKLRETHMAVGYVKNALWPERNTGEAERNLYRLQQASEMKLQILKDIAMNVKMRNTRTKARQEAIKKKKVQVEVEEGKLKKVLARKESEIQLLKGTLTHLRMTNAMRSTTSATGASGAYNTPAGANSSRAQSQTPQHSYGNNSFSRLQHLLYPNPSDSTARRRASSTPRSSTLSTGARRSSSAGKRRSSSGVRRKRSELGVSFSLNGDDMHQHTVPVLYHPMSTGPSPYDSRKRSSSAPTYRAAVRDPQHQHQQQQSQRRSLSKAELVDQLSEIFEEDFQHGERSGMAHYGESVDTAEGASYRSSASPPLVVPSKTIAKDWLASARASINALHRPHHHKAVSGVGSPAGVSAPRGSPLKSTRRPSDRQAPRCHREDGGLVSTATSTATCGATAAEKKTGSTLGASGTARAPSSTSKAVQIPTVAPEDKHSSGSSDSESENDAHRHHHSQQQSATAPPSFLNSLVEAHHFPGAEGYQDLDTTVSSIAVADIPFIPTAPAAAMMRGARSPKVLKRQTEFFQQQQQQQPDGRGAYAEAEADNEGQPAQVEAQVEAEAEAEGLPSPNSSSYQSVHSNDSLDEDKEEDQGARRHSDSNSEQQGKAASSTATPATAASRPGQAQSENIANLQGRRPSGAINLGPSSRVSRQLERNKKYSTDPQGRPNHETAEPARRPSSIPNSEVLDDFAKNKFSIRFSSSNGNGNSSTLQPATRSATASTSTGVDRRTIAQQLERNRKYDHALSQSQSQTRTSSGVIEESARNVASRADESMHAVDDDSGDGAAVSPLDYSISAALEQDVAQVSHSVESLQERVDSLKHQRKEQRVPPGWALRNPVISSTHTSRTSVSGTGPTPTAAVLTKAHTGRLSTAVGSADDSDTPDEKDIRMVFEDISSSSGEFDLLKHRHREKQ